MTTRTYITRRGELETYFDRTAAEAWARLTSTAPVGRVRATVRAGRDRMRSTLLSWLPQDLRGQRILDAGCGPGRVGAHLHQVGHRVVGVDVDPVLIAAANEDHPGPTWLVSDLAELDLPAAGITQPFDAIVSAGNVMTFLAPSTRIEVLRRLGNHLAPEGRAVIGFGLGRDYELDDYFADVAAAGLSIDLKLGTWDLRPFTGESNFLVSVLRR